MTPYIQCAWEYTSKHGNMSLVMCINEMKLSAILQKKKHDIDFNVHCILHTAGTANQLMTHTNKRRGI